MVDSFLKRCMVSWNESGIWTLLGPIKSVDFCFGGSLEQDFNLRQYLEERLGDGE